MRPKQRRDLGARLGEAEDVVDEEEHVLAFLIAEVFSQGETGQADPRAGARRLVHLTVNQGRLGALFIELDDAGFDHLMVKVVAFAGPLADTGEDRVAAMGLGDVVDQFHDQDRLAHTGAAEEADLTALGIGRQQVHDLDAGDQHLGVGRLIDEFRSRPVNGRNLLRLDRSALVDRLADHVDDPAQGLGPHRHHEWARRCPAPPARAPDPSVESMAMVRRVRSPRCWATSSTRRLPWLVVSKAFRDLGQVAFELNVHNRAHNLADLADEVLRHKSCSLVPRGPDGRRSIIVTSLPWRK